MKKSTEKQVVKRKSLVVKKYTIEQFYQKKLNSPQKRSKIISSKMSDVLENLPGIVSWKDIDSVYLGCNKKLAKLGNLKSPKDIIGKRACDFPWGANKYANIFRKQDEEVFSGMIMFVLGKYNFGDKERMVLVKKMPILNKSNSIIGTFNYISEFHQENLNELISTFNDLEIEMTSKLSKQIKSLFFSDKPHLSLREELCAYYLLKGLSAKEIGKTLGLSYRTVQFYTMRLKKKLNCSKISTLILKLLELAPFINPPHIIKPIQ